MADASLNIRIRVYRGSDLVSETDFQEQSITIGSAEHATLRVEDDSLGPLHAALSIASDGSVQLMDLGTENGTLLHGAKISNETLSSGDAFSAGDLRIEVIFDEPENTTPTIDVRPKDVPAATEAAMAAMNSSDDTVGEPLMTVPHEDIMELVMRSGSGDSNLGIDPKAPKVLEVNQIWGNALLDTKHYAKAGPAVTIGASIGWKWSLLGVEMGWIPSNLAGPLRASPPIWSDVETQFRNDFYIPEDSLPGGVDYSLFVWDGSCYVARIDAHWGGFIEDDAGRHTFDEALAAGKMRKAGQILEVNVEEGVRVVVEVDGMTYVAHMVAAGKKVVAPLADSIDYPFLGINLVMGFLGILTAIYIALQPPPGETDLNEIPDRFAELRVEKPEEEEKPKADNKPEADPDAGEGEKAKKEEGKVGKKKAKMKEAKGNKKEIQKSELDREVAENAGVLGALDDMGANSGFGSSGLNADLIGGIGGAIGAKGVQMGAGGLGSRGSGMGGGGTASGLGGLGTKGMGSGRSGFGKGGGSFGEKGSGRISATTGDPIVMGALDKSLIDAVIKRKMAQIRYCYQRELQKDPTLNGKIVIKFTIAKDGTVSKASVKSSTVGKGVDSCVVSRFYKMQFPEPKGGGIVIVSYPFIFSPG
ncbi:MAG: AgmX/PglI C-terminal domain-containing protein [Myxococcota bacterium]